MTTEPVASPDRPTLEPAPDKPDIVDRLRMLAVDLPESATVRAGIETLVEAILTIKALREMNQRHCDDERALNQARDDLALERDISAHRLERIGELEGELAALRAAMTEGR